MNRRSLLASVAVSATVALFLALTAVTPAAAKGAKKIGFSATTYEFTERDTDTDAWITITRTGTRGTASITFYTGPSTSASPNSEAIGSGRAGSVS